jgi:hypothetical protein
VRNLPPLVDDATKDSLKTRTYSPFGRAWPWADHLACLYLFTFSYYLSLIRVCVCVCVCAAIPRPAASKSNDILQKYLKEFSERSESLMLSFNRCVSLRFYYFLLNRILYIIYY